MPASRPPRRTGFFLSASCAACLWLLVLFVQGCSATKGETEPNDTPVQAVAALPGDVFTGEIRTRTDRDYYRILVTDNRLVNRALNLVLVHPAATDLRLSLYRDRKLVKIIDDYAAPTTTRGRKLHPREESVRESWANLPLLPGEYLVLVEAAPWQQGVYPASYRLEFRSEGRSEFSEQEPNNTLPDATPLEPGVSLEGYLSPLSDPLAGDLLERDYYKLKLDETNRTVLDVTVTGVPGSDIVLSFLDGQGNVIRKSDSSGMHMGEKISRLSVPPGGEYYILVSAKQPFSGSGNAPYTLRVDRQTHQPGQELEPNDTLRDANPLTTGMPVSGFLTPDKDGDWYTFRVPQPGKYIFSARLKGVPEVNTALHLHDKNGVRLGTIDMAGPGEPEYISNFPLVTTGYDQEFHLVVSSVSGKNDEDAYQLDTSLHEASLMGEFGDNDTLEKSNPLGLDVEKRGFLYPQDDRDWYAFSLPENRQVRIPVSGITGVDLVISLHTPDGRVLREVNGAGLHEGESIITDLPGPARYHLQIRSRTTAGANAREPYTVIVRTAEPRTLPRGPTRSDSAPTNTTNNPE